MVVHGFRNGSGAEVRYLNLHAPGQGFAAFMRALREGRTFSYDQEPPPAEGGLPISEAVVGADGFHVERPAQLLALLTEVDEVAIAAVRSEDYDGAPPPHVHDHHLESFFVLAGRLTLTAGDRVLAAEAGAWIQVPPGIPHRVEVSGSEAAHFLNLHTPSCGFGDFVRTLSPSIAEDVAAARSTFDQRPGATK